MATQKPPPFLTAGGWVLVAVCFVIVVLVGVIFFVALPSDQYFYAMLYTGVFCLLLAVATYITSSFTRTGGLRYATVGSFWFGIVMLVGSDLVPNDEVYGGASNAWTFAGYRILFLIIILILVAAFIGSVLAGAGQRKQVQQREDLRQEWRQQTGVIGPGRKN